MITFSFCFGKWIFKRCVSIDVAASVENKAAVLLVLTQLKEALEKVGVKASIVVTIG